MDRFRATRTWHYARWPVGIGAGLFALGLLAFFVLYMTVNLPDNNPDLHSSILLDSKGRELAVLQKDGLRVEVKLAQVAPIAVDALIASEDRRFYEHGGVDPVGLIRAVTNNVTGGRTQGGSTITQQLVKNTYLTSERTMTRKVKEAVLAIKLDRSTNKQVILERYLNVVYFGRGTYGIEAASRVYFNVPAKDLQPHQAALLIGLLRAPESADPAGAPDVATQRRNRVLDKLVQAHKMSKADADANKAKPLDALPNTHRITLSAGVAPFFVEWVRQQAITKYGAAKVYGGGLRITTTLDIDDQKAAEAAIAKVLTDPADPQAALVALDQSGAVRAYVGGRDYAVLKVDLARGKEGGGSGRQAGSTFKPFVLATALENGTPLGTVFPAPPKITVDNKGKPYEVNNYSGESFGPQDLIGATAHSVNTVYAQLMVKTGPAKVADLAHRAGIQSTLSDNVSLTLGTEEVSVLEMADAYLTFARDGKQVPAFSIQKVEGAGGEVLFDVGTPKSTQAIQEGPARAATYAMQQVIAKGTGTAAKLNRPVAGKTGTTQNNGDAWFAGYTPNYAAVVWMGFPESNTHTMSNVHGGPVTGGGLPARIWKAFMDAALADVPKADFQKPPAELLGKGKLPTSVLTLTPSAGDGVTGVTFTANGTGFERCAGSWYVKIEPGGPQSAPETGSISSTRSATLQVAPGTPPGTVIVSAWCDDGTGSQRAAEARFDVLGPTTTSSSSSSTSSSSTTSTTTKPTTTTVKPTTTTSSTSTSTTTTAPN
jgi:penicillin-binding protein 1A